MREKCVVLKLDLAKFESDETGISQWLDRSLQVAIDKELYGTEPASYDELQGVFHHVYQRWSVGAHKHLYESDPTAFKIKFGEHLSGIIDQRPHEYCMAQLKNIVRSRRMLPCVIFDNADQFSSSVQQAVFQYANAVYEDVKVCFLIVPITDQTVWQLSKSGPLQSYNAKSFFLPVPSTKEVLEKRIRYVATAAGGGDQRSGQYMLPNGFTVSLANLKAFAGSLEEIFLNNGFVARRIGYLSNFDIRRSLQLSKRLMTSPYIGIDELIRTFLAKGNLEISQENLSRALVNGSHRFFRQDQSDFIVNLFSVNSSQISSPLLRLRVLVLLLDKQRSVNDPLESFLTCGEIEQYFEVMGIPGQITRGILQVLLDSRLVEPYNPTEGRVIEGQSVSITTSGELHVQLALHDRVYFSQMALVTGLRDPDVASAIRDTLQSTLSPHLQIDRVREAFLAYCVSQDSIFVRIPQSNENYKNQRSLVDELQAVPRMKGVGAKVKWFNPREGYGFLVIDGNVGDAFLSLTVLEEFGASTLLGDQAVKCSISQSARGWQVTEITEIEAEKIEDISSASQGQTLVFGSVIFYNPSKGYGFVRPQDGGRDILLPRRTLNRVGLSEIEESATVLVGIEMEMKGPVATSIIID
jgi:cold shock CspA family protein